MALGRLLLTNTGMVFAVDFYDKIKEKLAQIYPNAIKIRLVQGNLNTYNFSSFYENLPADEAFELAQKFEIYYTPKSAI